MKDARFVTMENIVPLNAPVDSAGTAYATAFVDMKNALHATFLYFVGVMTAASADQNITVTMEAATAAASGSEVAIPFKYRVSGAVGANTWGAITDATTAGISIDTTGTEGVMYAIDIDPAALDGKLADARFVRMVVGIDAGGTVTLNAGWAVLDPRYPQLTHKSAT